MKDPNLLSVEDVREHCKLIRRSVETKEARFMLRVLRALPVTRRKMNPIVLRSVMKTFYTADGDRDTKDSLLKFVAEADELDGSLTPSRGKASATPLYPEVDFYMSLLVLIHLIDIKKGQEAVECAKQIMTKLESQNRRTLDLISAKCFFYYMRAHEMAGEQLKQSQLVACLRTATLRNDFEGQAVLINCLLRNYLHYNLYNQADKLVLKSTFPEQASNNE